MNRMYGTLTTWCVPSSARISGTAVGIDREGCLLVRTDRGAISRFHAGEVSLERPRIA